MFDQETYSFLSSLEVTEQECELVLSFDGCLDFWKQIGCNQQRELEWGLALEGWNEMKPVFPGGKLSNIKEGQE